MESKECILDIVKRVINKHRVNRGVRSLYKVVHDVSVELDQMGVFHDISRSEKPGYLNAMVYSDSSEDQGFWIVLPEESNQKFFNLLNQMTC